MACAGAIAAAVTGLVLASSEPITIGTDAPFPEYTHVDAAGTITGFEKDLMDEVCSGRSCAATGNWRTSTS
jgi:polar amino acid transport system substrate-binding protein